MTADGSRPKFCPHCGAPLTSAHLFCSECGRPVPSDVPAAGNGAQPAADGVRTAAAPPAQAVSAPAPAPAGLAATPFAPAAPVTPAPAPSAPPVAPAAIPFTPTPLGVAPAAPAPAKPFPRRRRRVAAIVAAVALVAALVVAGVLFLPVLIGGAGLVEYRMDAVDASSSRLLMAVERVDVSDDGDVVVDVSIGEGLGAVGGMTFRGTLSEVEKTDAGLVFHIEGLMLANDLTELSDDADIRIQVPAGAASGKISGTWKMTLHAPGLLADSGYWSVFMGVTDDANDDVATIGTAATNAFAEGWNVVNDADKIQDVLTYEREGDVFVFRDSSGVEKYRLDVG